MRFSANSTKVRRSTGAEVYQALISTYLLNIFIWIPHSVYLSLCKRNSVIWYGHWMSFLTPFLVHQSYSPRSASGCVAKLVGYSCRMVWLPYLVSDWNTELLCTLYKWSIVATSTRVVCAKAGIGSPNLHVESMPGCPMVEPHSKSICIDEQSVSGCRRTCKLKQAISCKGQQEATYDKLYWGG